GRRTTGDGLHQPARHVTITSSVAAGAPAGTAATFSEFDEGFAATSVPSITIDDQVLLPGGTWQDVGTLLQNPTTLVNGPVFFRSIVTNGIAPLTGVSLSDSSH